MNHKIIFTEDKMFVNGTKVKDYKKNLSKENEIMDAIKLADGLLPCPFCGGEAKFYKDEKRDGIGIYVKCINCGTTGKLFSEWTWEKTMGSFDQTNSELKALRWWNKRGTK